MSDLSDFVYVSDGEEEVGAEGVSYAENEEDNAFIHLIIQAVERCIAFETLQTHVKEVQAELLDLQGLLDDQAYSKRLYLFCRQPILKPLVDECKENIDLLQTRLVDRKKEYSSAQDSLRRATIQRKKTIHELCYGKKRDDDEETNCDRFLDRCFRGRVRSGKMDFRGQFNEGLAKLIYAAQQLLREIERARYVAWLEMNASNRTLQCEHLVQKPLALRNAHLCV